MNIETQTLDTSGMSCPVPIFRTQVAIRKLNDGEILKVLSTDPRSVKDFTVYCSQTSNTLVSSENKGNIYEFMIRKD